MTRRTLRVGRRALAAALKPATEKRRPPPGRGDWLKGIAMSPVGSCHFRVYRPHNLRAGEKVPLMVMLHGCGQDAKSFAMCTRMNQVAARAHFLVLYPEQSHLANAQGCWNWYDTRAGRAFGEAGLIAMAVEQTCLRHPVDRACIAVAGLSAGASMAALLATRYPTRFKALIMHSGIAPGTAHSPLSALGAMHGHPSAQPRPALAAADAANWPPLMVIQGMQDPVVASSNGESAARMWAEATDARPGKSRRLQRGDRYAMTVTDFKRHRLAIATLVEVDTLGHAWSGGAARRPFSDPRGPDASRMAWAFANRQFRRQVPTNVVAKRSVATSAC